MVKTLTDSAFIGKSLDQLTSNSSISCFPWYYPGNTLHNHTMIFKKGAIKKFWIGVRVFNATVNNIMAGSFIGEGNLSTTGKLKGHLRMES